MIRGAVSAMALAVMLAAGMAVPAEAQRAPRGEARQAPAKGPKLSKAVQAIAFAAQKLQTAGDHQGALAKLAEAAPLPKENDDAEILGKLKLQSAVALNDNRAIEDTLTELTDIATIEQDERIRYIAFVANLALQRQDYVKAAKFYDLHNSLKPGDPDILVNSAETYARVGDNAKAIATLKTAIASKKAAGAEVDESWYRRRVQIAVDTKNEGEQLAAFLDWVRAFPKPDNWRDAVLLTRDNFGKIDDQLLLDFGRFQAATKSLKGERDYVEYADTALGRGFPGEAKAAIDAGIAARMLDPAKPLVKELKTSADGRAAADKASLANLEREIKGNARLAVATADAHYGYGNFDKAATLYRSALAMTGADATLINLRLGAALAMAGDKAGASEVLKAVQGGPRGALAQYWLAFIEA